MTNQSPADVTRMRIAKWMDQATPISKRPTWTEQRLVIDFGGHTYPVTNGQVFQCAHCGHYDPEWSATEVLEFFEKLGHKPYEITVNVSVVLE